MATSGVTTWTLNRDQVIKGALRKLGVLPSGGSPTANQTSDANEALNSLLKAYEADGMPLWKVLSTTFTTVSGTNTYNIGPGQTIATTGMPLKLLQAFYTVSGGTNTPINVYTRYDFNQLPQATTITGTPVNIYYQPLRTSGVIKVWPTPNNSTTTITVHYQSPYEDMVNSTDDFDFPSYWMQALIYGLAWTLASEYGLPLQDRKMIGDEAQYWHQLALSFGSEEGSLFFQPRLDE